MVEGRFTVQLWGRHKLEAEAGHSTLLGSRAPPHHRYRRYGTASFGGIIYPADELNAMFVATRVIKSSQTSPSNGCNPERDDACPLGTLTVASNECVSLP